MPLLLPDAIKRIFGGQVPCRNPQALKQGCHAIRPPHRHISGPAFTFRFIFDKKVLTLMPHSGPGVVQGLPCAGGQTLFDGSFPPSDAHGGVGMRRMEIVARNVPSLPPIDRATELLSRRAKEMTFGFPKTLVVIGAYQGVEKLESVLARIPTDLLPLIHEITVFDPFDKEDPAEILDRLKRVNLWEKLTYCRIPRRYDYGENLKNCFDYALKKGFDYVAILRGDGLYDPACLPLFLYSAVVLGCPAVMGDRTQCQSTERPAWAGSLKAAGNRILSVLEELILATDLRDYHCGYKLIATRVLKRIPYGLNSMDYRFDLQLLIQIRCLGVPMCTVPVPDFHDPHMRFGEMVGYGLRAIGTSAGYRLHQLHLLRNARYFVDLEETYTLKRNRYSSHMQILDSLEPGAQVLDIGCGQSLLAEEYAKRGMSVVGVDVVPPEKVSPFVKHYIPHDLEMPLNLPYGRDFNSVILSDVIEHIKDRDGLMNSLRRHLKSDGHLIASTGNVAIWFYRLSLLLGRFEYGPRGILDRTHVHLFTLDSFTRFFQQSGYTVLETRFTPIPFELVFSSTGRSALIERITRWYYYLSIVWPRLFAYQFIVHCTFRSFESALGEETWQPSRDQASPGQSPGTARPAGLEHDTRGTRFPGAKKQALSGKVQRPED